LRRKAERFKMKTEKVGKAFRVKSGKHFRLKDFDPANTGHWHSKEHAEEALREGIVRTAELQDKLYAQDTWALLLIFQAMDAAGKDGTIKHVMSGVNPQGCEVFSFKAPSAEELGHGFLWRTSMRTPARGKIGIFNRSYYEEVLVVRVHPEILEAQRLPQECVSDDIWKERFEDITAFERYATRNGVAIRKFFLNMSKEEQKRRFLSRLDQPEKNWKFSASDVRERRCWDDYQRNYEEMIRNTSSKHAPWIVVPADNKWFARLVVSSVVVDALKDMKLAYPEVSDEKKRELATARRELEGKAKPKKA
jgi:PPK2 family polyphosphate:nucleotide phosphotransferase